MKRKITLIAAALLVLGLAIVAFAYTTDQTPVKAACACCKGDSCPMKKKDASATQTAASADCDCCKGDSCPMHKGGDSCPMHKAGAGEMKHESMSGDAKTCDCSCCSKHKDEKQTSAV